MTDNEQCFESFKTHIASIDIVGPQSYKVDEHGILWGSVDNRIVTLSAKNGVKVMPLVVNAGFDQPTFHSLLHDSLARVRAINNLLRVCRETSTMESSSISRTSMCRTRTFSPDSTGRRLWFCTRMGMRSASRSVPRTSDDVGQTDYHKWIYEYWRGAYDYKALAEIGDFISLMTYDQHTHRTTPGPVAGIPWMEAVIQFVLKSVPPSKISLGIPFYSYRWQPSYQNNQAHVWGRSLDWAEARGIVDRFGADWQWDDREKVNFAVLSNDYLNEYLYLEDARSFAAKFMLVGKYGFRGVSVWRLGHEDPDVWQLLKYPK